MIEDLLSLLLSGFNLKSLVLFNLSHSACQVLLLSGIAFVKELSVSNESIVVNCCSIFGHVTLLLLVRSRTVSGQKPAVINDRMAKG